MCFGDSMTHYVKYRQYLHSKNVRIYIVLALQVFNSSALGQYMMHSDKYLQYLHMYKYSYMHCIALQVFNSSA